MRYGNGRSAEIMILNKVVRMTDTGIEPEADPRHAELVISEFGRSNAKPSLVPGSKTDGGQDRSDDGHTEEAIHPGKDRC